MNNSLDPRAVRQLDQSLWWTRFSLIPISCNNETAVAGMRPSLDAGNKAPSKVATEKRNIRRLEAIGTCDHYLKSCVFILIAPM